MAVVCALNQSGQLMNQAGIIAIPLSITPGASNPFSVSVWINANWGTSAALRGRRSFVGIYGSGSNVPFNSGFTGVYYSNMTLTDPPVYSKVDPTINFDFGADTSPGPGIPADGFSIRWTGNVLAPTTGNYTFQTVSDDGVRLYVNGVLVINNWTDHSPTTDTSAVVALTAGTTYPVILEYYENAGGSNIQLFWEKPGDAAYSILPPYDGTQGSSTATIITGLQIGTSTGGGDIDAWTYGGAVMTGTAVNSAAAINNNWASVTYTYDGTNHVLYVNGVQVSTATTVQIAGTLSLVTINGYPNGQAGETDAHIVDAYRLYNRALTAGEALTIYNAGGDRHGIDYGQIAYYEFDEGIEGATTSTCYDLSGNGAPLSAVGSGTLPKYTYLTTLAGSSLRPSSQS